MNVQFVELKVRTIRTTETLKFSPTVLFLHGPVGTGKSTVARLIDFCLGGRLERTPAIQQEFVAAELALVIGSFAVRLERAAHDHGSVRATWSDGQADSNSVNAPLDAAAEPITGDDVFNLSDLLFWLSGIKPIKVRKSRLDPESPLVRLSFRDLMWYCYLEQDHLDSSFFRMEDPFKKLKSRDAMRFITGAYSERMNDLEISLVKAVDEQRTKRETVRQLRVFMARFHMGSELDLESEMVSVGQAVLEANSRRDAIEQARQSQTHAAEPTREKLRRLSAELNASRLALGDLVTRIQDTEALRSELITAKVKAARVEQAGRVLQGTEFHECPQCGTPVTPRFLGECTLCGKAPRTEEAASALEMEALRRDINDRIDDLQNSIARHRRERIRQDRRVEDLVRSKATLDEELENQLAQYDSAYVSSVRAADRDVARLQERQASLSRLREIPQALSELEEEAGSLQGTIDRLRSALNDERRQLKDADARIKRVGDRFLEIMRAVRFPGVFESDRVELDPRTWLPIVIHGDQSWTFYDAGSGGKKTLFNVCYALAVHTVAAEQNLPLPTFLVIDSPTKNISEDENPELVSALYREIYALAAREGRALQLVLIDSDLVQPEIPIPEFAHRRMAGEPDAPCLISYYTGP